MNDKQFEHIFALMKASFPTSERRSYTGQKELLADPHYRLITKTNSDNQVIAFMAVWEFPSFRFIEHIAVDPNTRGSGIGGKIMASYIEESSKPILLEVEYPDTDMAQRRIGFYERLGFRLNPFDYVQPPLQEGETYLPLKIMSYPRILTEEEFIHRKEILYTNVYKVTELPSQ
ncbi:GNAT family N-acetyltransferase [Paenibacillus woosongensis]|uniref:GNAT family N-acetyltransferase n=1 Tax=Paenibacillus woosongensis TaxID=307580 RepID=A0A7X3CPC2_9BACL|nr:GNAT family N-acetyltransferase [Paenibacillus woosongensis]MUG45870.1 GNAT family N-acetyltransferase [Paenibacillus woosongensis]